MKKNQSLSKKELQHYARHIVMPEIGGNGQQKLKQTKILVVGAGGLGCAILQYLTCAGIGTLAFADDDKITISNLQRQVLFGESDIGKLKVDIAKKKLAKLNSNVILQPSTQKFTANTAKQLLNNCDLVLDACDNFATRHILANSCERAKIPLISSAVGRFDGTITTFKPWAKDSKGNFLPRYCDIFPNITDSQNTATCAEVGIVGALCGVVGSLQALEAIKEILQIGEGLAGKLLMIDGFSLRFQTINYNRA